MSFIIVNARTSFFSSKEEYLAYKAAWKTRAHAKNLTAQDYLIHALMMGKDVYRAFSPNQALVKNGQPAYYVLAGLFTSLFYSSTLTKFESSDFHARFFAFLKAHRDELMRHSRAIEQGKAVSIEAEAL